MEFESFSNKSPCPIDETFTGTTPPEEIESDKNCNAHSPDLQNWSFTIRCSLVSYPGHIFVHI